MKLFGVDLSDLLLVVWVAGAFIGHFLLLPTEIGWSVLLLFSAFAAPGVAYLLLPVLISDKKSQAQILDSRKSESWEL